MRYAVGCATLAACMFACGGGTGTSVSSPSHSGAGGDRLVPAASNPVVPPPDNGALCPSLPSPGILVLHPGRGVAGQYVVVFRDSVADPDRAAADLARKYSGEVIGTYKYALKGCVLRIDDALASTVANEVEVCRVEQDIAATLIE